MKLGDTGLIVDYIVTKLRDKYPDMDSGEKVSWSGINTKYLIKYLESEMPDMLSMVNIASNNTLVSELNISNGNELILSKDYELNDRNIISTLGVVVDTYRGTPYDSNPMKLISVPVTVNKKYRINIEYDASNSIYFNDNNPTNIWDLQSRSFIGITRGTALMTSNTSHQEVKEIKSISDELDPTDASETYYKYNLKDGGLFTRTIDQVINITTGVDELSISGKFKVGETTYNAAEGTKLTYVPKDNEVLINPALNGTNGTKNKLLPNEVLTYGDASSKVLLKRSEVIYDLTSGTNAITGLTISIEPIMSGNVILNTNLQVKGKSKLGITDTLYSKTEVTGIDGKIVVNDIEYEYEGTLQGGTVNFNYTKYSITKNISIEYVIKELPETDSVIRGIYVNDSKDGYNLLLQLPKSTLKYSILEVIDNEDIIIDTSKFDDGLTVTDNYLDVILLDRTITKYSLPDDIEYLQEMYKLFVSIKLSEGKSDYEEYVNYYPGIYDDKLRDGIKKIQGGSTISMSSNSNILSDSLNRSNYISGWCDPETEIFMEITNGY